MKKIADVLELIDSRTAKVMLYKHNKCTGCGYCNKAMHPGSVMAAENQAGAKPNDKVSVIVKKKINILEFIIMYILPTVMFLLGLMVGGMLINLGGPNFLGVLLALIFLIISIVIYFKTKHKFLPQYSVKIVKVIAK